MTKRLKNIIIGEALSKSKLLCFCSCEGRLRCLQTKFANRKTAGIDLVTGRYIQSDPIGFDGGINTYVYVGANPVVRVDESGLIDPRLKGRGVPRAMGGDGQGISIKELKFSGVFETLTAIGVGETLLKGHYNDEQTGKSGKFTSKGFAWGIDASIGGIKGHIFAENAYNKFFGKGTSLSAGIGSFGGGIMLYNHKIIGYFGTLDESPLPASFTFTTEDW